MEKEAMDVDSTAGLDMPGETPLAVDVLSLISDARMTFGLRHQDYQRYREHCTRRVRRLRQILKLSQANNKKINQTKALPAKLTDERYFHLYIYDTERAWAYAMELKQDMSAGSDSRKRHHLVRRLKKASQIAESLSQLAEAQKAADRTLLDIKAYAATMKAYTHFEQEHWQAALDQFVSARTVYERFADTSSNPRQEALCYSAIDEIDPNIRFCAYKLRLNNSVEEIVKDLKNSTSGIDNLQTQLDQLSLKENQQKAQGTVKVTWRNKQLAVKDARLAKAIAHAQTVSQQHSELNQTLSHWVTAEKLAKKAIKEDHEATLKVSSSRSAQSSLDLKHLHAYIAYNLYLQTVNRDLALIEKVHAADGKPQESIKLYDNILRNLELLKEIVQAAEVDNTLDQEIDMLVLYYRARRCFQIARAYSALNQPTESLALYQATQAHIAQTKQVLIRSSGFNSESLITFTDADLRDLEQQIRNQTWKARALWYLEHEGSPDSQEEDALAKSMEGLQLGATEETALINRLDSYSSGLSGEGASQVNLVDFPPPFEPVVCKPFYFDLAANHLQYPQSLYGQSEKSSGLLSKFFGFGR